MKNKHLKNPQTLHLWWHDNSNLVNQLAFATPSLVWFTSGLFFAHCEFFCNSRLTLPVCSHVLYICGLFTGQAPLCSLCVCTGGVKQAWVRRNAWVSHGRTRSWIGVRRQQPNARLCVCNYFSTSLWQGTA